MSILGFLGSKGISDPARALYRAVVEQSRQPAFYRNWGVADTPAGRFEMIALHAFLLLHRLKGDAAGSGLGQEVFDLMFADMDRSLREMGVGDLGVGKRVKRLAQGFYGRVAAYEGGLKSPDPAVLAAALSRNLYANGAAEDSQLAAMADYIRRQVAALAAQPLVNLCAGRVEFAPPPASPRQGGRR
ncbi:MAG: ubiquinol-cytochrome C chaperone family protein [Kiloniellales bacterium]